jgi:acetate kinase
MNVLILNSGSSSVKFQIIDTDEGRIAADTDRRLAWGLLERWGARARVSLQVGRQPRVTLEEPLHDPRQAVDRILHWIGSPGAGIDGVRSTADIHAVGHRIVHGGEKFTSSVRIDPQVLLGIQACIDLAPLHNAANLAGVRAAEQILGPDVPQVAVFDTAFHASMPETSFLYGIPYEHYQRHKIRRYGFHGTSHRYMSYRYRRLLGLAPEKVNIITLHLGNGCSACAIKNGRSYDTSMGFTPLEGLLMGTRCGDVDASIVDYLASKKKMTAPQIHTMLNNQSGLLGISGLGADMRALLEAEREGNRRAALAIELFCYRVRKYVGAYFTSLGGADAVVFTAGIGENSPPVRRRICEGLQVLGLRLDEGKNATLQGGETGEISDGDSKLKAYVIPTNEELLIARDTYRIISGTPQDS